MSKIVGNQIALFTKLQNELFNEIISSYLQRKLLKYIKIAIKSTQKNNLLNNLIVLLLFTVVNHKCSSVFKRIRIHPVNWNVIKISTADSMAGSVWFVRVSTAYGFVIPTSLQEKLMTCSYIVNSND